MSARQKDGAPLRDHLEALARGGDGEAAQRLANPPSLSRHAAHVWRWYADPIGGLAATRPAGGFGPSRIPRQEIQAWERDEGVRLEPWERRALLALDSEQLLALSPAGKDGQGDKNDGAAVEEL